MWKFMCAIECQLAGRDHKIISIRRHKVIFLTMNVEGKINIVSVIEIQLPIRETFET